MPRERTSILGLGKCDAGRFEERNVAVRTRGCGKRVWRVDTKTSRAHGCNEEFVGEAKAIKGGLEGPRNI